MTLPHNAHLLIEIERLQKTNRMIEEERARLESQLRHVQKMEAIGQLTGGIAHDFNNLLTAIIGSTTLIEMKLNKDSEVIPYLHQILEISERAANLIRGLLAFSRKFTLDVKPLNLNKVTEDVGKLLARFIGEDIELQIRPVEEDIVIMGNGSQIEQVLLNLATNARDAMPEGGFLSISTDVVTLDKVFVSTPMDMGGYGNPGSYALLTVSDTGKGMDDHTRERIFDPFFTTKEADKGTGLGLSIVYGIIKQHNGYIDVYSAPGKGTTFRIYFPLLQAEIKAEVKEAPALVGGSETLLLVEDEADVRKLIKTILDEFGYTVIVAGNGEDAIKRFSENRDKIGLVILDVILPEKSGKEVYKELRDERPGIKTIFISGYAEELIRKQGIIEGDLDFISKPLIPSDLLRKVREVLDRKTPILINEVH